MSSLGQDMRYELRMPGNKPASGASGVWWLWQDLTEGVLLGIIAEPLGEALRIPYYKGLSPVRLTYHGLIRQIRAEWRVPISLILSTGGNDCSAQPQSRYRYSIPKRIAMSLKSARLVCGK